MRQVHELITASVQAMEYENWPVAIEKATEAGRSLVRVLQNLAVDENPVVRKKAAQALQSMLNELHAAVAAGVR